MEKELEFSKNLVNILRNKKISLSQYIRENCNFLLESEWKIPEYIQKYTQNKYGDSWESYMEQIMDGDYPRVYQMLRIGRESGVSPEEASFAKIFGNETNETGKSVFDYVRAISEKYYTEKYLDKAMEDILYVYGTGNGLGHEKEVAMKVKEAFEKNIPIDQFSKSIK